MEAKNDLVGDDAHGGRGDLEPAEPPHLSHAALDLYLACKAFLDTEWDDKDQPDVETLTAMLQMHLAVAKAEGRKSMSVTTAMKELQDRRRVLMLGGRFTEKPLSKDHQDDIHRWIHDLDLAIAALSDFGQRHENFKANEARMREHYLAKLSAVEIAFEALNATLVGSGHQASQEPVDPPRRSAAPESPTEEPT